MLRDRAFNLDYRVKNFSPVDHRKNTKTEFLSGYILAGDIGGTNARFALFELVNEELKLFKEKSYKTKEHHSFLKVLKDFCGTDLKNIESVCIGVAGPVSKGKAQLTNSPWLIDRAEIIKETNIQQVWILNDMEAHAYALKKLKPSDYYEIKKGTTSRGNAGLISPGTGLGEAGILWEETHFIPFASEGGHCDFSPRTEFDRALWHYLNKKFGHVSWERIISGPGIYNLYLFLLEYRNIEEPKWFSTEIKNTDRTLVISKCAKDSKYPVCKETIDLFIRFLAIESAQLALKFKATKGIYIGGGILPKNLELLDNQLFKKNFVDSNKMNPLLEQIPVKVILNEKTALTGAALFSISKLKG